MKYALVLIASVLLFAVPAQAQRINIVTPAYTLQCDSVFTKHRVTLVCVPRHTEKKERDAFQSFRYGDAMPRAMFIDTPTGNGGAPTQITAGDASITIGGTLGSPTIALSTTQPNANVWNGVQTFANFEVVNYNATTAGVTGAPIAPLVFGTATGGTAMGTNAISLCPVTGGCGATAASNSQAIVFQAGTGSSSLSCAQSLTGSTGTMSIPCKISNGTNQVQFGNTEMTYPQNLAANSWNGTCASVSATFHCVTGTVYASNGSPTGMTCEQLDTTNHAVAVDTNVTLTANAAYTFTSTIPNGFVGSTSTAPTTTDTVVWWCRK